MPLTAIPGASQALGVITVHWLVGTVRETVHETPSAVSLRLDVDGWPGRRGRVGQDLLTEAGWPPEQQPRCFICGPTPFVEVIADALVDLGHLGANVRAERFGPTGPT